MRLYCVHTSLNYQSGQFSINDEAYRCLLQSFRHLLAVYHVNMIGKTLMAIHSDSDSRPLISNDVSLFIVYVWWPKYTITY